MRKCAFDEHAWVVAESRADSTDQKDYWSKIAIRMMTTSDNVTEKGRPMEERAEDVDLAEVMVHKSHEEVIWRESVLAELGGRVRRIFPLRRCKMAVQRTCC